MLRPGVPPASLAILAVLLSASALAQASPFPARALPHSGRGYVVPPTWAQRGLRFGRPELVGLVQRAAARVSSRFAASRLYVADLSLKSGAATPYHHTHRTGCDVDLIFYALDARGRPAPPPAEMVIYDNRGRGTGRGAGLRFDTRRNWALVKALIMDPRARVTRILVSNGLKRRLLEHGVKVGDEPELLARAAALKLQPGDSLPHDDHFHVRIEPGAAVEARARRAATPARERPAVRELDRRSKPGADRRGRRTPAR
jgi:penicillin-insensitive murein endopeptidase